MDYEKKYKESLEKARQLCAYPTSKPFISDLQDLFPELKESEDERIRKNIIAFLTYYHTRQGNSVKYDDGWITWLKKQGEHANFLNKIQIGDNVTRNQDGVLVNLSQLDRVAKKDEKYEQKPAWSEEDEEIFNSIKFHLDCDRANINCYSWLDELKDRIQHQSQWKPSKEQVKALEDTFVALGGYDNNLRSLINDLKKLTD